jgi:hypothetical protein
METSQSKSAPSLGDLPQHAEKLRSIVEELRKNPHTVDRFLGDLDHVANAIGVIATLVP